MMNMGIFRDLPTLSAAAMKVFAEATKVARLAQNTKDQTQMLTWRIPRSDGRRPQEIVG